MIFELLDFQPQLSVHLLQLLVLFDLWVNIFDRNVADIRGHTCISQSLQGLFIVSYGGVETCDHNAVGISSYRLLEKRS
jgi:hypothetical protein